MNNSLERLIGGIIATLRNDVIPNVAEPYARGQAIGIIDLLNNIAPKLEWERAPLLEAVAERRNVISEAGRLLRDEAGVGAAGPTAAELSSKELMAERDRLDAIIADLATAAFGRADAAEVSALLRKHMHNSLAEEMKLTKKPLFAEIAKGGGKD